jgi:hypothetical protein
VSQRERETTADYLEPLREQAEKAKQDILSELEPVSHDISEIKGALQYNPRSTTGKEPVLEVSEDDLDLRYLETQKVAALGGKNLAETVEDLDRYKYQLAMEHKVYEGVLDVIEKLNEPLPGDKEERINRLRELEKQATDLPQKTRHKVIESFHEESGGSYSFGEEEEQQGRAIFENSDGPFPALKGAALSVERIRDDLSPPRTQ